MIAQTSKCLAELRVGQFPGVHCTGLGLDPGRRITLDAAPKA